MSAGSVSGCHVTRRIVDTVTAAGLANTGADVFYAKSVPKVAGAFSLCVATVFVRRDRSVPHGVAAVTADRYALRNRPGRSFMFGCSLRVPDLTCKRLPVQPYWQEVVLGVVAFGLLCLVLMKFVFPRMEQTLQARVDAIEGGLARAEATRAEAAQALAEFQEHIAGARAAAAAIRETARADSAEIRDGILAAAREEAGRIVAAGRQQMQAERHSVVHELRGQIDTLAAELAGRVLGESVSR